MLPGAYDRNTAKERTSTVPENLNCSCAGSNDDVFVHEHAYF